MTTNADNAYGPVPATEPLALKLNEGLGPNAQGPAHLAPQPAPGLAFDEHGVLRPMVHALAAIDAALGLPADGCNSTQQTLAAIKKLKDGRDAFQESLYAELDTNFRLRDLGGAKADESMTPFLERVIAERDTLRRALRAMLDDDDHDAAKNAARAALAGLGA